MKKLAVLTVLVLTGTMAAAQSKTVEAFKKKYDSDVKVISLTGSIFKLISSVASFEETDQDAQVIARIAQGIESMDILTIPMDKIGFDEGSLSKMRQNLKKEKYDDLMTISEGGNQIYVLSQSEGGSEIKDMVVLIREKSEFMLMNINGSLNMNDLAYLAKNHDNWH